jgi:hypothetical protein
MDLVMELTGCGPREAAAALAQHKEIWLAVDALLEKPVVSGEKYIPKRPTVDSGMTEEQKERCDKGRWLQDQVNAVVSGAHSQSQSPPDPVALEAPSTPAPTELSAPAPSGALSQSMTSSLPGTGVRSPLPSLQSESLLQISSLPQCGPETPLTSVHRPPDHPAPAPHPPTLA